MVDCFTPGVLRSVNLASTSFISIIFASRSQFLVCGVSAKQPSQPVSMPKVFSESERSLTDSMPAFRRPSSSSAFSADSL